MQPSVIKEICFHNCFIHYKKYYALLNRTSSDVDDYLNGKDLVSCDTFAYKIRNMYSDYSPTVGIKFNTEVSDGMSHLLIYSVIFKDVKENIDRIKEIVRVGTQKQREEERRIERENRIKGPYLDTLRMYLKEHIDFFAGISH